MSEVPSVRQMLRPCLEQIASGSNSARGCLPGLKAHFELSEDQMEELLPSGNATRMLDRATRALRELGYAGLIQKIRPATYAITQDGTHALKSEAPISWAFINARKAELKPANLGQDLVLATSGDESDQTPHEAVDIIFRQLSRELADDLLEQVLSLTPARFERLIVDLLIAMGYGDGRAEMGRAIGRSGDGGIDGVVNEDRLGLDAVYIQAKRYALENTVGRPALQAFVGSLTGENATKGVFVTTSSFSSGAREYVRLISQRVVLIDGQRLARLMIDHGVGVVAEKTYVLHQIDANFFDEA